jgi:hypothetical protein
VLWLWELFTPGTIARKIALVVTGATQKRGANCRLTIEFLPM